jgi:hypothetical protein
MVCGDNQKRVMISHSLELLYLRDFLKGNPKEKSNFSLGLANNLYRYGYFYLNVSGLEESSFYQPFLFETYQSLFNEALLESPFLKRYMHANSVFEDGYNLEWFPDSTTVDQPIEAILLKPRVWKNFRGKNLPPGIRKFLDISENIYHLIYDISFVLFDALEDVYGFKSGSLKDLFKMKHDGATRFVKYHRPNSFQETHRTTTYVSKPHVDESFFTVNLGESRPGLIFFDDEKEVLLPGTTKEHLLITSGIFSAGLTRFTDTPIREFKHTVKNTTERVVGLCFVAPEGGLHHLPIEKWPILKKQEVRT